MVEANQRSGFGHAISLKHGIAEAIPERLEVIRQGCAARNDRPEFPAKAAMDSPEAPPTPKEVSVFGSLEIMLKLIHLAIAFFVAQNFPPQRFDHPRNCDQHRYAL